MTLQVRFEIQKGQNWTKIFKGYTIWDPEGAEWFGFCKKQKYGGGLVGWWVGGGLGRIVNEIKIKYVGGGVSKKNKMWGRGSVKFSSPPP